MDHVNAGYIRAFSMFAFLVATASGLAKAEVILSFDDSILACNYSCGNADNSVAQSRLTPDPVSTVANFASMPDYAGLGLHTLICLSESPLEFPQAATFKDLCSVALIDTNDGQAFYGGIHLQPTTVETPGHFDGDRRYDLYANIGPF